MPQVNFLSTQVIWMQLAPLQAVINGNIFAVSISCCVTNQSSAVSFSQAECRAVRGFGKRTQKIIQNIHFVFLCPLLFPHCAPDILNAWGLEFGISILKMWKSCEIEICPWHDTRYKRKGSYQAKSSKKKSHKKKSESILKSEPNEKEEQKINAGLPAKVIPSESETNEKVAKNDTKEIKDKSENTNGPEKKKTVPNKTSERKSSAKQRPKTAPASHHQPVVRCLHIYYFAVSLKHIKWLGFRTFTWYIDSRSKMKTCPTLNVEINECLPFQYLLTKRP